MKAAITIIVGVFNIPLIILMYLFTVLYIVFDRLSSWCTVAVSQTFIGLTNWMKDEDK